MPLICSRRCSASIRITGLSSSSSPLFPVFSISVVDALCHPYLAEYSSPEDEPISMESLSVNAEEDAASTIDDWRGQPARLLPGSVSVQN